MPSIRERTTRFRTGFQRGARSMQEFGTATMGWATYGAGQVRSGWSALGTTSMGKGFKRGFAEAYGFAYSSTGQYEGFLGIKKGFADRRRLFSEAKEARVRGTRVAYARMRQGKTVGPAFRAGHKAAAAKVAEAPGMKRIAMGAAGKAIVPLFTAMHMYYGYQEGGVLGAAKAGMIEGMTWGAFEMAKVALGSPATWAIAGVAAAGYGYYQFGEAAQEHRKRLRNLEMGAPVADPFGTGASMRRRSIMAMQSSHINGRLAMGNEALMMHNSAYSPRR